ncbi:GxxExxY protein [Algoriphagus boritolerans]|uniref:GxxExxY protein n=1 Tax=Algoriphagus boritolerans DSM 17298 = JCM 18970 TaxID=1120964 RepID=A0A1H5SCR9_9BACT|nr:GxxExxY protein [Algoriphagus boritolerans]SEF48372.1 GxxExxY protein [Algoriphagus boritolerans DSM 17298 = JCM 18970]
MDSLTELNYKKLLDACFKVHKALGPGLLESSYELCLAYELQKSGLQVATQVPTNHKWTDFESNSMSFFHRE